MAVVIKVADVRGQVVKPGGSPAGSFIADFDPEANDGWGDAILTEDIDEAMRFDGFMEAHQYWTQQPESRPIRPDGRPNRPLTAFSIEIVSAPDDE